MRSYKRLSFIFFLSLFVLWTATQHPATSRFLASSFGVGEFQTFESQWTPQQIIARNRDLLAKSHQHKILSPVVRYVPHVLLGVKYSANAQKTEEARLLWSLQNGEIVKETRDWTSTHGYRDCLLSEADATDYQIIHLLTKSEGRMNKADLQKRLGMNNRLLESALRTAMSKKLVLEKDKVVRLHFENPQLLTHPFTKLDHKIVNRPNKHADRLPGIFSQRQVRRHAQAAFGKDLAIRRESLVYLPIIEVYVMNPDGSIATTRWNAVTGKQMKEWYSKDS